LGGTCSWGARGRQGGIEKLEQLTLDQTIDRSILVFVLVAKKFFPGLGAFVGISLLFRWKIKESKIIAKISSLLFRQTFLG
jgi:hypothetical protein